MTKLTKTDIKRRDEIAARLRDRRSDLNDKLDVFNKATAEAWEAVETELNAYNEAIEEAHGWASETAGSIGDYIDGKSDAWQEGDKGQAVECFKKEYENIELEFLELTKPDDIDLADFDDHAELLEQLPEAAD